MNRTQKLINLVGIGSPVAGLAAAVVLLWNHGVGPAALAILAVGYVLTGSRTAPSRRFRLSATCSP